MKLEVGKFYKCNLYVGYKKVIYLGMEYDGAYLFHAYENNIPERAGTIITHSLKGLEEWQEPEQECPNSTQSAYEFKRLQQQIENNCKACVSNYMELRKIIEEIQDFLIDKFQIGKKSNPKRVVETEGYILVSQVDEPSERILDKITNLSCVNHIYDTREEAQSHDRGFYVHVHKVKITAEME